MKVVHRPAQQRFDAVIDGQRAFVYYAGPEDGRIDVLTTFVPQALRGRGLGRELVEAAVGQAREQGWEVAFSCAYARRVMDEAGQE